MIDNQIKCRKYNYGLDNSTQNQCSYKAFLQRTPDGKSLNITNRKPVRNFKYILEPDINTVNEERAKVIEEARMVE